MIEEEWQINLLYFAVWTMDSLGVASQLTLDTYFKVRAIKGIHVYEK